MNLAVGTDCIGDDVSQVVDRARTLHLPSRGTDYEAVETEHAVLRGPQESFLTIRAALVPADRRR